MIGFRLTVQVVADETGRPLPGLFVKAYDKDLLFDDLLGGAVTDRDGRAVIVAEQGDFAELFDRRPDIYFKIYTSDRRRVLMEPATSVRWGIARDTSSVVRVPLGALPGAHAEPVVQLFAGHGSAGGQPVPPAVGDSLMISAVGLVPAAAHDVEVRDETGPLFVSRLMTDQFGVVPETVLWPQFGLDDPRSDAILTVDEADRNWRGRTLGVRLVRGERVLAEGSTTVGELNRPLVLNTGADGRMLNGFEDGQGEVVASGYNIRHNGDVRIYLVASQADWRPGDAIVPVALRDGTLAVADARPDAHGRFRASLAGPGKLAPGAYDFIVRRLRFGYEDDDDFIFRDEDLATRQVTGIVVREEFWASKVVRLGCVNMLPLAGRSLNERPYFKYGDAFAEGEDVWAAIDPAALPPVNLGKMVAIYVVPSKTAAQWDADKSLSHLAALGGNAKVIRIKTQVGCINYNKVLVWPAASGPGAYDVVLDFGLGVTDPLLFTPDDTYTIAVPPQVGDIIDGYLVPGFRIIQDPGVYTDPQFAHVGGFDYINEGSLTVVQDNLVTTTVPLTARVRFPADIAGATSPGQISTKNPFYPMTIIVHGNGHTYLAYDYLLEHWAANGFIAASIWLNNNQTATDRAKVLFEHINKLKTKFGGKAQNNIGIMGHSRGGEGVATAPRLNHDGALGHNLNAVISLAPTNQHVDEHIIAPWVTPYYVIYGSLDRDVTGEGGPGQLRNCGFALYDKADGASKAMLFVYGATHDRFLAPPGDVDWDYSLLSPADKLQALSAPAHHAVAQAYMTAYFRQQLLNDPQFRELFNGEWVPPTVAAADGGKAKLFSQVREAAVNRRIVDDFEGAHTAASWKASPIAGGTVTQTGLVADPTENFLYVADSVASPHETSGLVMRWDGPTDKLEFSFDPQDVTAFQALSFRVTQKYDPGGTINPLNADQDFYVALRDSSANERAVRVAKFGHVVYPHVRGTGWLGPVIKSALCTIRIPLHAFTVECAGAVRVDLSKVVKVGFLYGSVPNGELEVDDVEFST